MAYQSTTQYLPNTSSDTFVDHQWSSCMRSNSIDSNMGINPLMLTPLSNYSIPIQHIQQQQQPLQEFDSPLDHPMIPSLPNQFLKKLHCILTYEILPNHIYWSNSGSSNSNLFTIRFETDFVHKYLPQLFQFYSISSVVKLLSNYGFKKVKKQKQSIQTYKFQHPSFSPQNFDKIDSIIADNPNLDPYGEFIDNFLNQFNYCKLNEFQLKLEINTLEETNNGLKIELEGMRRNINQLNMVLYFLETGQFDKINLEDFSMLNEYQSPNSTQALLMPASTTQSTNFDTSAPIDFGLIDALTMSENTCEFIAPSLKLPSGFPQAQLPTINNQNFGISNEDFISFNPTF